jgi:hypothetical protein
MMSEQAYNSQMMTQYLLGVLNEADAERFDELSITDDEFAEALKAAENELVDAYAQGELADAELKQFESHYLASPLRREKVEFAQTFRTFNENDIAAEAAEVHAGRPSESAANQDKPGWFSALNVFKTPRLAWQWGTACAALALLIVGGWLLFENTRLRQQIAQTQPGHDASVVRDQQLQRELEAQRLANEKAAQELARAREESERLKQELKREQELAEQQRAGQQPQLSSPGGASIASFILTPQMRDSGKIREVPLPPDSNSVVMHLQLDPNAFRAYRVYLLDGLGGKTVWRSNTLRAKTTENGKTLDVGMRSALLKPQTYILQVKGVSADGASEVVGDYPFKVVK